MKLIYLATKGSRKNLFSSNLINTNGLDRHVRK
jgi:hypothetical protein